MKIGVIVTEKYPDLEPVEDPEAGQYKVDIDEDLYQEWLGLRERLEEIESEIEELFE